MNRPPTPDICVACRVPLRTLATIRALNVVLADQLAEPWWSGPCICQPLLEEPNCPRCGGYPTLCRACGDRVHAPAAPSDLALCELAARRLSQAVMSA